MNTLLPLFIRHNIYMWKKVHVEFNWFESCSSALKWRVLDKYKYKHDYFYYPWFKLLTSKGIEEGGGSWHPGASEVELLMDPKYGKYVLPRKINLTFKNFIFFK